jgi:hypothetical protein
VSQTVPLVLSRTKLPSLLATPTVPILYGSLQVSVFALFLQKTVAEDVAAPTAITAAAAIAANPMIFKNFISSFPFFESAGARPG